MKTEYQVFNSYLIISICAGSHFYQVIHHPWLKTQTNASSREPVVLSRMKEFSRFNKFKKEALKVLLANEWASLCRINICNKNTDFIDYVGPHTHDYVRPQKHTCMQVLAGSMPDEHMEGLRNMFVTIDKDGSGSISVDEMRKSLKQKGANVGQSEVSQG